MFIHYGTIRYDTIRYTEDDNNDGVWFSFGFIFECSNPPIVARAVYSIHTLDFIRMVKLPYSNLLTYTHSLSHRRLTLPCSCSCFVGTFATRFIHFICWYCCYFFFLFIVVFYSIFRPIIYVAFVLEGAGKNESD